MEKTIASFKETFQIINIGDYNNRLDNYKKAITVLNKIKKNQCLVPIQKTGKFTQYQINDNQLILVNRIGSNSKYGAVYLTTTQNKLFKFATKLTPINMHNYKEIILSKQLSDVTLANLNPHFLLIFKLMICNNKNKQLFLLPRIIRNENYYISINELVSGNLKNFLYEGNHSNKLILNALQQVLLAVLSFHHFTEGIFHRDCHSKNFLFHKITPGGYFHYQIFGRNVYVENLGFIWMIWDFGLVKSDEVDRQLRIEDYIKITYSIYKYNDTFRDNSSDNSLKIKLKQILNLSNIYKRVFDKNDEEFMENLFDIPGLFQFEIPENSKIINNKPYIIN